MFKSCYRQTPNRLSAPFFADLSAGFYVFLLAVPLSLTIAEASGFPAVMGLLTAAIQVLLGFFKFGKWVDLIPPSSIQGMLAAIGVVILSKQLYILLGIPSVDADGKSISKPLSLIAHLGAGIKLASLKVLVALKKIGPEQIWGFSVTLIGSLAIDLLWGLILGTLAKLAVERWSAKRQKT